MGAAYLNAPLLTAPVSAEHPDDPCAGRHRFPTEETARQAQQRLSRHRDHAVNAYRCEHCKGAWHVGSMIASHLPARLHRRAKGGRR